MNSTNVNPTYPVPVTEVYSLERRIWDEVVLAQTTVPTTASLRNEGDGVKYTRRIAVNQAYPFDEGDRVSDLKGYYNFRGGAVLYFHEPSRDAQYQPPTPDFLLNVAQNTMYPMVVEKNELGVWREVPHAVVARFAMNGSEFVLDKNHAPVLELITLCCDPYGVRFDQKTHIKEAGDEVKLFAGVIVQDWGQVTWRNDVLPTARPPYSQLQYLWLDTLWHCRRRINLVPKQEDCVAQREAN